MKSSLQLKCLSAYANECVKALKSWVNQKLDVKNQNKGSLLPILCGQRIPVRLPHHFKHSRTACSIQTTSWGYLAHSHSQLYIGLPPLSKGLATALTLNGERAEFPLFERSQRIRIGPDRAFLGGRLIALPATLV